MSIEWTPAAEILATTIELASCVDTFSSDIVVVRLSKIHLSFGSCQRYHRESNLRKILPGCQQMTNVPNGVETLRKISIACLSRAHERYRQTTDRRMDDDIL